ncbi:MAG: VanZ family protein [Propionibacteriaceae bacterium]|jgi:glycopeptide antibiotics resistance protein|nr:VanZ family protein [Propionibacteriaceae bacterium]
MIPYALRLGALLALVAGVVYAVGRLVYVKTKGKKYTIKHEVIPLLFVMYIAGILALTFYRPPLWNGADVNLIPFKTIIEYFTTSSGAARLNLIGNVVFFAPFGLFVPALFEKLRRFLPMLAVSVGIPLIIEIAQFVFGRSADVDDVILNALGILAGYAAYRIFRKRTPQEPINGGEE